MSSYHETRTVILPDGQFAEETRIMLLDGQVRYAYWWAGQSVDLSKCEVEYNGQVLDATEPDWDGALGALGAI